jgi:hypothetical protein
VTKEEKKKRKEKKRNAKNCLTPQINPQEPQLASVHASSH